MKENIQRLRELLDEYDAAGAYITCMERDEDADELIRIMREIVVKEESKSQDVPTPEQLSPAFNGQGEMGITIMQYFVAQSLPTAFQIAQNAGKLSRHTAKLDCRSVAEIAYMLASDCIEVCNENL